MAFRATLPGAVGAAFAASALLCSVPPSHAGQAEARAAIAAHCERCHPPLPAGGWEVMTARPHDPTELSNLLRRMEEEYSAFPDPEERRAILEYLEIGHWRQDNAGTAWQVPE